jgi:biotin carboxyl carrier protein
MKMEHVLHAPDDGTIVSLEAQDGEQLQEGAVIARLEREPAE